MTAPLERVRALVAAARRLADASDALGRRAREELPESSGLSPEGVELALTRCLETHPSAGELDLLVASTRSSERAHVLLSANVLTAAHRASALALAAAPRVAVRPSRREPRFVELLREAGAPIDVVGELDVRPEDQVWAFGTQETLDEVAASLPANAVVHAHGPGLGVAVVDSERDDLDRVAGALAADVVPFDQRGCLSPRIVFAIGDEAGAAAFARSLAGALERASGEVPLGRRTRDEAADARSYRDTVTYAGVVHEAGPGVVGLTRGAAVLPPPPRNVHVVTVPEVAALGRHLEPWRRLVTTVGRCSEGLAPVLSELLPAVRHSRIGEMQSPPLDGPVDRRER